MARKTADIRELGQSLKTPSFSRSAREPVAALEPVSPTTLVLGLAELKPYERNPRRTENAEFERIKDSIAEKGGLTTPLVVTKRPGDEQYTIAAGGNSRLKALNELYRERGDEVFNRVTCQFEPWDSDCRVLADHLIENDVRGNMTFADKARAIVDWQALYEAAHPEEAPLSQRSLERRLAEAGFKINHALLSRYLSAAEFLLPVLPKAFETGLGRPRVEELIRLRRLAQQFWEGVAPAEGADGAFEAVFAAACVAEDRHCDDWSFDFFRSTLALRMAEALALDAKHVAMELDNLYRGVPTDPLGERRPEPPSNDSWAYENARKDLAERNERARRRREVREGRNVAHSEPATEATATNDDTALVRARDGADLETARGRVLELARSLAQQHELSRLLKPSDIGLGFYVEAPEPPDDGEPPKYSPLQSCVWWWLAACADQFGPAQQAAIGERDPDCWFVQLAQQLSRERPDQDPLQALGVLVGALDWHAFGGQFLSTLTDESFSTLIELVCQCRSLIRTAEAAGMSLWAVVE